MPDEDARYTMETAVGIASLLYPYLEEQGLYLAVTGGCLYKAGRRKDVDLILYRNREKAPSTEEAVDVFLKVVGRVIRVQDVKPYGFVTKMKLFGVPVDLLFPEYGAGTYKEGTPDAED